MNETVADLSRRLEQLERRVERLDAPEGGLAREVQHLIERVNTLAAEQERTARALADHLTDHHQEAGSG
jgi:hypothetical protein